WLPAGAGRDRRGGVTSTRAPPPGRRARGRIRTVHRSRPLPPRPHLGTGIDRVQPGERRGAACPGPPPGMRGARPAHTRRRLSSTRRDWRIEVGHHRGAKGAEAERLGLRGMPTQGGTMSLAAVDPEIAELIKAEERRQANTVKLIPSENYVSKAVLEATGTVLTNKYSEGYAGKRYYEGQQVIDQIETLAIERAKALFGVPYANVQPYSGSPANLAIYMAFLPPGDTVMGMGLRFGGHLTPGWSVSRS